MKKESKHTGFTFIVPSDMITGSPVFYLKRDKEGNDLSFMRYKDAQGRDITIANKELLRQYQEYQDLRKTQPMSTPRRWYRKLQPNTRAYVVGYGYLRARPELRGYVKKLQIVKKVVDI